MYPFLLYYTLSLTFHLTVWSRPTVWFLASGLQRGHSVWYYSDLLQVRSAGQKLVYIPSYDFHSTSYYSMTTFFLPPTTSFYLIQPSYYFPPCFKYPSNSYYHTTAFHSPPTPSYNRHLAAYFPPPTFVLPHTSLLQLWLFLLFPPSNFLPTPSSILITFWYL